MSGKNCNIGMISPVYIKLCIWCYPVVITVTCRKGKKILIRTWSNLVRYSEATMYSTHVRAKCILVSYPHFHLIRIRHTTHSNSNVLIGTTMLRTATRKKSLDLDSFQTRFSLIYPYEVRMYSTYSFLKGKLNFYAYVLDSCAYIPTIPLSTAMYPFSPWKEGKK